MTPVIRTYTGRMVNPLDLRPEDICIEDIAHALALCNRFAGHTKFPINVAQHSLFVAHLCPDHYQQALLHDASEAYLGDVTKWLKRTPTMAGYREAEDRAQRVICSVFGIPHELPHEVEEADRLMVHYEGKMGFGEDFLIDHPHYPPLTEDDIKRIGHWTPLSWESSEAYFLYEFYKTCKSTVSGDSQ